MAKPPILKPREVEKILKKLGFVEVRQRGSHKQISTSRWPTYNRSLSFRS